MQQMYTSLFTSMMATVYKQVQVERERDRKIKIYVFIFLSVFHLKFYLWCLASYVDLDLP